MIWHSCKLQNESIFKTLVHIDGAQKSQTKNLFIYSFSNFVNFSCFDILESITLFQAENILKNTLNMYKALRIAKSTIVNKNECKYLNVKITKNALNALTTSNG